MTPEVRDFLWTGAKGWAKQTGWLYRIIMALWLGFAAVSLVLTDYSEAFRLAAFAAVVTVISIQSWMIEQLLLMLAGEIEDDEEAEAPRAKPQNFRARFIRTDGSSVAYDSNCPDYPGPCLCSKGHRVDPK